MDVITAVSLVVLLLPILFLALLGLMQLNIFMTYNPPLLPVGSPGEAQRGIVIRETTTAQIKGDFVVFLVGAVVHNWWDVRAYGPVFKGFGDMMKELRANPECGFLGGQVYLGRPTLSVQYWRSFDHLLEYARNPSKTHFPVWVKMRSVMRNNRSFGVYHETFKVSAGQYECIYNNMPSWGLGGVCGRIPVSSNSRLSTARGRAGETDGTDHPDTIPERPN